MHFEEKVPGVRKNVFGQGKGEEKKGGKKDLVDDRKSCL